MSSKSEYSSRFPRCLSILTTNAAEHARAAISKLCCQDSLIVVSDLDSKNKEIFRLIILKEMDLSKFWQYVDKIRAAKRISAVEASDRRFITIRLKGGVITTSVVANGDVVWMARILDSSSEVLQFHVTDDANRNYFQENYNLVNQNKWRYF